MDGLEPDLDPARYAPVFAENGRIQIRGFLPPKLAQDALDAARPDTPWNIVFHDGARTRNYAVGDYMALSHAERADVERQVIEIARREFGFMYFNYRMDLEEVRRRHPGAGLNAMLDFVRSERVLDFVRRVTREDRIVSATAQATCYAPGHFLTTHNDLDQEAGRLIAYVISLSPRWTADWGGVTLFYDEVGGSPVAGITPVGGAITLFRIPQWHAVSMVTPLAAEPRYSITGWFVDKSGV